MNNPGSRTAVRLLGLGLGAVALAVLAGCGSGGGDGGTSTVRVVNVSSYNSLDFYIDGSAVLTGAAVNNATSYVNVSANVTHSTSFDVTGTTTPIESQSRGFVPNTPYTLIAYGWEGGLGVYQLSDNVAAPASGQAEIRVISTAPDPGALDIYVTGETDDLSSITPIASNINGSGNPLSAFTALSQGTYRIRVLPYNDKSAADVRLDIHNVQLSDQQIANLVLTPGPSGVLVNGLLVNQGGAVTAYPNPNARVRLVAGAQGNSLVQASLGGTSISSASTSVDGLRSPNIGSYVSVAAGSALPVTVSVTNSGASAPTAVAVPDLNLAAGQDLTLLVYDDGTGPKVSMLDDDNRLPTNVAQTKLRLVNGLPPSAGELSLVQDFASLESGVGTGADVPTGSPDGTDPYLLVNGAQAAELDVTSPSLGAPVFSQSGLTLQANEVYTLFALPSSTGTPTGVLHRDR